MTEPKISVEPTFVGENEDEPNLKITISMEPYLNYTINVNYSRSFSNLAQLKKFISGKDFNGYGVFTRKGIVSFEVEQQIPEGMVTSILKIPHHHLRLEFEKILNLMTGKGIKH